eukprot:TRINITY_DN2612_c0_g1_i6.p1 TRINITY_DN2612_c0_g1~~TRINITY_DN2612_c0_g1_i6.p1  ORF type:complete len:368 (+),score=77.71 TRINITY_DN2612_c0_g1_i6:485-1588(+)
MQTRACIDAGAVPVLIEKVAINNLGEQCLWCLSNIAGDSTNTRDVVIDAGLVEALTRLLLLSFHPAEHREFCRNAAYALSNVCRGKPAPHVEPDFGPFLKIFDSGDTEAAKDLLWAISYISEEKQDLVMSVPLLAAVVRYLQNPEPLLLTPALRTLGNLATGNAAQTQAVIDSCALPVLTRLLDHPKQSILKEVCWTFSNITAGTIEQIQSVLDAGAMSKLVELMENGRNDVQKEACWAVSNCISGGSRQQVTALTTDRCLTALGDLLRHNDARIVGIALEAFDSALQADQQRVSLFLEEHGFLNAIEMLQDHMNEHVYYLAGHMLATYFDGESDGDADYNINESTLGDHLEEGVGEGEEGEGDNCV